MTTDGAAAARVVVVLCTAPLRGNGDRLGADALAQRLVEERLCACVNLVGSLFPVTSWFRWEGRVDRAQEGFLILKTTAARLAALQARLQQLHPYAVPEVLAIDVANGLEAYLQWVRESVAPGPRG